MCYVDAQLGRGETIHPRKGTETKELLTLQEDRKKQFIPARGRKRGHPRAGRSSPRNNSSPQGDGNSDRRRSARRSSVKQFIPARGRKHTALKWSPKRAQETIHPRKGTETAHQRVAGHRRRGNNSSPQGDGNPVPLRDSVVRGGNNSSPQGDGNLFRRINITGPHETIHPRKGTETGQPCGGRNARRKQFIPARGRKRAKNSVASAIAEETIHPRKGTETAPACACASACRETIHPRKGTETQQKSNQLWRLSETIHPRKGTETRERRTVPKC